MLDFSILDPGCPDPQAVALDLPLDGVALLVAHPSRLDPAKVLYRAGIDQALDAWIAATSPDMPILRRARRTGWSEPLANDDDPASVAVMGSGGGLVMVPASYSDQRWWVLVLSCTRQRLGEDRLRAAECWLRRMQGRYEAGQEPEVGRAITDAGGQLLHSNATLHCATNRNPADTIAQVIRQWVPMRWPDLTPGKRYDATTRCGDTRAWLSLWPMCADRRQRESGSASPRKPGYWLVESRTTEDHPLPPAEPGVDPRVHRALGLLDIAYAQNPDLSEIAAHVETSPYHFHRLFSQEMGMSPKAYLQRKQMQMACQLLRATRQPISDIARRVGYTNHGHFTSSFQRVIGTSPSRYRESV